MRKMDTGVQLHVRMLVGNTYKIWILSLLLLTKFSSGIGVKLDIQDAYVTMDNGSVQVTLTKPEGMITDIKYNGIDNLLDTSDYKRGYWDLYWNEPGNEIGMQEVIKATNFEVILQNDNQVEVSFTRPWSPSLKGSFVPLNIDKRFIMLQGLNGFYTYSIFEHLEGWPDFHLNNTRIAFKLSANHFQYMVVDDVRQGNMPSMAEREQGQVLAYKEAVLLADKNFFEKVDDKYQWSSRVDEIKVHGWVGSSSGGPLVGFWQITPSFEFRGGPFKQELTSHCGPISITNFFSAHYMGQDQLPFFRSGEYWKKVYGPVFIYLNSGLIGTKERDLWDDANNQLMEQTKMWPYSFPASEDFAKIDERGSAHGRLFVQDRYINDKPIPAAIAYVGLALPGEVGSWQTEFKGHQFWTRAGIDGSFDINNVRVGTYNLYATIPGFVGDYMSNTSITITPGNKNELGDLLYILPRVGPNLWEIGYPDRLAAEFFIPDPDLKYFNPLFKDNDRFRQYGLWEQYSILYPTNDLVYTIDKSDYRKDWFFAQVTRNTNQSIYLPTTWQIRFSLNNVLQNGLYTLRVALASSSQAILEVRFNDLKANPPHFSTGALYKNNAIARHGIHGTYSLFNIDVQGILLVQGENVIFLTQIKGSTPFNEVMYDYIRFEGPSNDTLQDDKN